MAQELCSRFSVDPTKGLTLDQVKEYRDKHGKNELSLKQKTTSLSSLALSSLQNQPVLPLGASAAGLVAVGSASGLNELTHVFSAGLLTFSLTVVAGVAIETLQRFWSEKAAMNNFIKNYAPPSEAKVIRNNNTLYKVAPESLVPGDIIYVTAGDRIAADARILEIYSKRLQTDESMLTGEYVSIENKEVASPQQEKESNRSSTLFSGTDCISGKARAVVIATGSNTAIASIASHSLPMAPLTPAFKRSTLLLKTVGMAGVLFFVLNNGLAGSHNGWTGIILYCFKLALVLVLIATPKGEAMLTDFSLALEVKKMARKGVDVRSSFSIDALSRISVVCTNKTGTLTVNEMNVTKIAVMQSGGGAMQELSVSGTGYQPDGEVTLGKKSYPFPVTKSKTMRELAMICSLCNEASISYNQEENTYSSSGDPTEVSLRVLVEKLGTPNEAINNKLSSLLPQDRTTACSSYFDNEFKRLATLEFTHERSSMSVVVQDNKGQQQLLVKGSPEAILERCTKVRIGEANRSVQLTKEMRQKIAHKITSTFNGLRCIAFAKVESVDIDQMQLSDPSQFESYEQDMVFIGLAGIENAPREEAKDAVKKCKTAGIRLVVVTGDSKHCAEAACRQVGIFEESQDLSGQSYNASEFKLLSKEEKDSALRHEGLLISLAGSTQRQEILKILKSQHETVALMGNTILDGSLLRRADVGITGDDSKDVVKHAADMVLSKDDNSFIATVDAIEDSRSLYDNVKQLVRYLATTNMGEIVSVCLTLFLQLPKALIPVQLIWASLLTNGLPALALCFNIPDIPTMRRLPRKNSCTSSNQWIIFRYALVGAYIGCAAVFGYVWWFMYSQDGPRISFYQLSHYSQCSKLFPEIGCDIFSSQSSLKANTIGLSVLVVVGLLNAMNNLSESTSLSLLPASSNLYLVATIVVSMALHLIILHVPFLARLFSVVPLTKEEWLQVVHISAPLTLIEEALKLISRTWILPPTLKSDTLGEIVIFDFSKIKK